MDKDVLILAIESSCDETAAAVVRNGREVLSNDYKVKQNDKITLKGKGKIVFLGENGVSKKGKIIIDIKRYI